MTSTPPDAAMTLPQGDVGLLETKVAQRLLVSTELARVAYVAADGTPRVFPTMFHWNGTEVVMATGPRAHRIAPLRTRPDVAITIDSTGMPPEALLIRGRAEVTDFSGAVPEYGPMQGRYGGDEFAAAAVAEIEQAGTGQTRIAVRPNWVGVLDFQTRFPGGVSHEEFMRRQSGQT